MKKYAPIYTLLLILVVNACKGQDKVRQSKDTTRPATAITFPGPDSGVRHIKQDKKGNIWIASNDGIFKYDGKAFTNITGKISSAPFFTVLEDRKGNFWFASLAGVFYYDGT